MEVDESVRRRARTEYHVNKSALSWRPTSLINITSNIMRSGNPAVFDTKPVLQRRQSSNTFESPLPTATSKPQLKRNDSADVLKRNKTGKNTIVSIVLVEAKGLPDLQGDGLTHGIYCKFRFGSHTYKSKSVPTTRQPQWRQKFKLSGNDDQLLQISVWDKGKQKNFMGSCVLDLSTREIERTHDIWQELDKGYGSVHLSVTICNLGNDPPTPGQLTVDDLRHKYAFYNVNPELEVVGQLHVKVIGARGLNGKPNAYCTLELDNEKIQTPKANANSEPVWNKSYVFNIFDVSSVLEIKVQDSSLNSLLNGFLGRVSIPLLRIVDGETRWYALKDNNKRKCAKGNCPRLRLEISMIWNPVTASLKMFRPKPVKYTEKPPKFNLSLVYKNMKVVRDIFDFLGILNDKFKGLFEWDDRELNYACLFIWMLFWYLYEPWVLPLLISALFPIFYIIERFQNWNFSTFYNSGEITETENTKEIQKENMADIITGLPDMTLSLTSHIEYAVFLIERLYNLATFKVPFLTYLTALLLVGGSTILYWVPFKYLMMCLGLYKFMRKRLNPDRVLNNDLLDFISRVPNNKLLKDWKELSVPEPQVDRNKNSKRLPIILQ